MKQDICHLRVFISIKIFSFKFCPPFYDSHSILVSMFPPVVSMARSRRSEQT